MSAATEIAIIGAGPYGLSLAAHLRARGMEHRIVGSPMQCWLHHMPKGMLLKSDGFASNLYDPEGSFTLAHYCEALNRPYADTGLPVRLDDFCAYGLAFQQRFVPALENRQLVRLERSGAGFRLRLDDGESFLARKVVLAIGIGDFRYIPEALESLPAEHLSHSADHHRLDRFRGREVAVIGGGASAIDLAALLHERGAMVQLVTRRPALEIHAAGSAPQSPWQRLRGWRPRSGIGPSWRARFFTDAATLFHYFPERLRLETVRTFLGPAGGWFMKDRIARVPLLSGRRLVQAWPANGRAHLTLAAGDGSTERLISEHVIAATGYRVDLRRLAFLGEEIRAGLRAVEHTPILSSTFQSSLPGLYFIGPAAANSFGPVMRFAFGAGYTARRLARHLARRTSSPRKVAAAAATPSPRVEPIGVARAAPSAAAGHWRERERDRVNAKG